MAEDLGLRVHYLDVLWVVLMSDNVQVLVVAMAVMHDVMMMATQVCRFALLPFHPWSLDLIGLVVIKQFVHLLLRLLHGLPWLEPSISPSVVPPCKRKVQPLEFFKIFGAFILFIFFYRLHCDLRLILKGCVTLLLVHGLLQLRV